MNNEFQLDAQQRTNVGKGASRRLRRLQDQVPAIIYGGEKQPSLIMLEHRHIIKAIQNEAFFSHIIELNLDGNREKVLIKDLQRHPFKQHVLHVDFQRVTSKEILHRHVPLHFINEDKAPGLKQGGVAAHNMKDVEITCSAAHLPEYIEVDLSDLELNHSIHLSDLVLPANIKLTHEVTKDDEHDQAVVTINVPRAVTEKEATEESAADETADDAKAKKSDDKTDE